MALLSSRELANNFEEHRNNKFEIQYDDGKLVMILDHYRYYGNNNTVLYFIDEYRKYTLPVLINDNPIFEEIERTHNRC